MTDKGNCPVAVAAAAARPRFVEAKQGGKKQQTRVGRAWPSLRPPVRKGLAQSMLDFTTQFFLIGCDAGGPLGPKSTQGNTQGSSCQPN
jgi:hypothetical protein